MDTIDKKHHYLITGEVIFREAESNNISALRANGILLTEDTTLGVAAIGKAQQVLQMNFHKKMEDPTVVIVDVVLFNLTYLGYMTEEEFQKTPPGMTQQKVQPETITATAPGNVDALDQAVNNAGI